MEQFLGRDRGEFNKVPLLPSNKRGDGQNLNLINILKPFKKLSDTQFLFLLADPGEARGCSTNTFVIDWFIH